MNVSRLLLNTLLFAFALTLAACGGSGGGDSGGGTSTVLTGTAAAGAPIIGQVTVKDALGATKSVTIEANGNYSIDVSGMTAPFRLRAEGTVGGRTYKLYSYAAEADVGGTVNINPFTDLIIANAARQVAETFFDSNAPVNIDPAELDAQETALQAKLQNVFTALGIDAAIDILHDSFTADHTGLDAALDAVRIEPGATQDEYIIRNYIENTSITDSITNPTDTGVLAVNNQNALTDTQQILVRLEAFSANFANGLPGQTAVQDYIADDFLLEDRGKAQFLTDLLTDSSVIGLSFTGVTVSDLDLAANPATAMVTFNVTIGGATDPRPEMWHVVKDATNGWQMRGDQLPVDFWFQYHCNDNDYNGADGSCGLNIDLRDNDFTNNGTTGDAEFRSATASLIDGTDGTTVKAVIYLGTPANNAGGTAGELQIYNAGVGFQGDWKGFGSTIADIDHTLFAADDTIQYDLYVEDLDTSNGNAPAIATNATPAYTFVRPVLFAPSTTTKYPTATTATVSAIQNFTLGSNLNIEWTLAAGTRSEDILVQISDSNFNRIEVWENNFASNATTTTIASADVDATAASSAGLDPTATEYNLLVRIYAMDTTTGQDHSRDYNATIPGPGSTGGTTPTPTTLSCSTESGWDDTADGGMGAPVPPYSFADFETVVNDCGALDISLIDVAGTVFTSGTESTAFYNTGKAATAADPESGLFSDTFDGSAISFEWYIEPATCAGCNYSYVVFYTDSSMDQDLPAGFSYRQTTALTAQSNNSYSFVNYSEQSNYGDMIRANGTDGEIWKDTSTGAPLP